MQSLSRIGLMSLTYATAAVVVDSDPLDAVVPVDVVVVVTVLGEAGEAEAPPHAVKMIATCELGLGAYCVFADCCSASVALNIASWTSVSRLQFALSMNGLPPPAFSFAYFSCTLYCAPWSPSGTSHGSARTTLKLRLKAATMAGVRLPCARRLQWNTTS